MASDEEGEFLFVGEKNGNVKIWNMGQGSEPDSLKQKLDIGTGLNTLSFETKFFSVISLGTEKGLNVRDIKGNYDIFKFPTDQKTTTNSCLSLAWDQSSIYFIII